MNRPARDSSDVPGLFLSSAAIEQPRIGRKILQEPKRLVQRQNRNFLSLFQLCSQVLQHAVVGRELIASRSIQTIENTSVGGPSGRGGMRGGSVKTRGGSGGRRGGVYSAGYSPAKRSSENTLDFLRFAVIPKSEVGGSEVGHVVVLLVVCDDIDQHEARGRAQFGCR